MASRQYLCGFAVADAKRRCFGSVACRTTSDELASLPGTHPNLFPVGLCGAQPLLLLDAAVISTTVIVGLVTGSSP